MTKKSTAQRSKEYLESMGWTVGVVEQTIPHTFIKRDLFGMFDLVAICEGHTMGVQVTSDANVAARVKKLEEAEHLATVRDAGWIIMVHGWKLKGKEYVLRKVDIS